MRSVEHRKTRAAVLVLIAVCVCGIAAGQDVGDPPGSVILVPEGTSIQEAVDGAPENSVIQLPPGRYAGNLILEKSLTMRGPADGEAVITGTLPGAVVRIVGEAIDVRLEDVTICSARGFEGHGVTIEGSAVVALSRVALIDNAWFGLCATDHAEAFLADCTIATNGTSGIMSQDFARLRMEGCVVRDNTSHGLLALHLSELTVEDSEIRGNWAGLWAWDATRIYLSNTLLADNADYGGIASNAALLVIEGSTVAGNGHHGLLFEESSRGVLRDSRILENGADGLFAEEDAILEIYGCEFALNGRAGLRVSSAPCIGGFDPKRYFAGRIEGARNIVPGPDEPDGNRETALCPSPPDLWPQGFVHQD